MKMITIYKSLISKINKIFVHFIFILSKFKRKNLKTEIF